MAEVSKFFYTDRSSYVLSRWQKFLYSSLVEEVLMFSGGGRNFSVFHSIQVRNQAFPASYIEGNVTLSPRVKLPKREPHHSFPSSSKI
jgi:hypothetical protein